MGDGRQEAEPVWLNGNQIEVAEEIACGLLYEWQRLNGVPYMAGDHIEEIGPAERGKWIEFAEFAMVRTLEELRSFAQDEHGKAPVPVSLEAEGEQFAVTLTVALDEGETRDEAFAALLEMVKRTDLDIDVGDMHAPTSPSLVSGEGDEGMMLPASVAEVAEAIRARLAPDPPFARARPSLSLADRESLDAWASDLEIVSERGTVEPDARPVSVSTGGDERLRERVAQALYEADDPHSWAETFPSMRELYRSRADRVIGPVSVYTGGDERTRKAVSMVEQIIDDHGLTGDWRERVEAPEQFDDLIAVAREWANLPVVPVPSTGGDEPDPERRERVARAIYTADGTPHGDWDSKSDDGREYWLCLADAALAAVPASASVPEDAEEVLEDAIHAAAGVHDEIDVAAAAAVLADRGWRLSPVPGVDAEGERITLYRHDSWPAEQWSPIPEFIDDAVVFASEKITVAEFVRLAAPVSPVTEDEGEWMVCDSCGTRSISADDGDGCGRNVGFQIHRACPGTFRATPDASQED